MSTPVPDLCEATALEVASPQRLFTPGPLSTTASVKEVMRSDFGSRDPMFIETIRDIRRRLVALAEVKEPEYTAVLMQGSGTFALESVVSSCITGPLLVLVNGAYGRRLVTMAERYGIPVTALEFLESEPVDPERVVAHILAHPPYQAMAVIHSETTTGMINPIEVLGEVAREHQLLYLVDAMSSFGGMPLPMGDNHIDFLVSSANKCIQGVPGFAFVVARREVLEQTGKHPRTLSLDLLAQWKGLEKDGQFRFTPPTHALVAFHQALIELEQEGGVDARCLRYLKNRRIVVTGLEGLGFTCYLPDELKGPIITSFHMPKHPNFSFQGFYDALSRKGFLIYPGKVSQAECFRIGHIGDLTPDDSIDLVEAISDVLDDMDVDLFSEVL